MSISILETALADLVTEVKNITIANSYRNTLGMVSKTYLDVAQITDYPAVSVVFNNGNIDTVDSAITVFNENVDVALIGYVSGELSSKGDNNALVDSAESLLHDLKVCLAAFVKKYLNTSAKHYIINRRKDTFKMFRVLPVPGTTKGIVGIYFQIVILRQTGDFST